MVRQRVRICFRKEGDLRLASHRDLMRALERLFRRAQLRLSMSEGYHPKPRMSFPAALALGIAANNEIMDVELAETPDAIELRDTLNRHAPPGLQVNEVQLLPPGAKSAAVRSASYEAPIPPECQLALPGRIAELLAADTHTMAREQGRTQVDVRAGIEDLSLRDGVLRMRLRVTRQANVRPREVLAALGLADLEQRGVYLTRTHVELAS